MKSKAPALIAWTTVSVFDLLADDQHRGMRGKFIFQCPDIVIVIGFNAHHYYIECFFFEPFVGLTQGGTEIELVRIQAFRSNIPPSLVIFN